MQMKRFVMRYLVFVLYFILFTNVNATVNVGMTINNEGLKNFYFSIGEFFRTPEKEVVVVRQQGIPDDELAVVFFLASRAKVPPAQIIKWRMHNRWTWMKIVSKLRLSPEIFYVPVEVPVRGGYYGKIYGYYQQPKNKWKHIRLTDAEIIHCINLHFISGYYGYKPVEVIKMRDTGKNFVVIYNEIKAKKGKEHKIKYKKYGKQGKGKH